MIASARACPDGAAYIVMGHVAMAYIVMGYIVMASARACPDGAAVPCPKLEQPNSAEVFEQEQQNRSRLG